MYIGTAGTQIRCIRKCLNPSGPEVIQEGASLNHMKKAVMGWIYSYNGRSKKLGNIILK